MQSMGYIPTQLPLFELEKLSRRELRGYFERFLAEIPFRIRLLENLVRADARFSSWSADLSSTSLIELGEWFTCHVQIRNRTAIEVHRMEDALQLPGARVRAWELTSETFAIAHDIGVYMGEVCIRNVAGCEWTQLRGTRSQVDYGRPVLCCPGLIRVSPFGAVVTIGIEITEKREDKDALFKLCNGWLERNT